MFYGTESLDQPIEPPPAAPNDTSHPIRAGLNPGRARSLRTLRRYRTIAHAARPNDFLKPRSKLYGPYLRV